MTSVFRGPRSSVVVKALSVPSIYLILPAYNRNEYQKLKNNVSGEQSAADV
jgi:hypothetical protein